MTIKLGYSDDAATVLFHVFTSLVYLFPILGAIVADSFLGKFR
jgi:solute carrier family 15 (oligopeptide transporter), member 1